MKLFLITTKIGRDGGDSRYYIVATGITAALDVFYQQARGEVRSIEELTGSVLVQNQ